MANPFKETEKGTKLPLVVLKGKEYLEVKYRLVWFREKYPTWSIETEFVSLTDKSATAKATIKTDDGRIIATAHKFENVADFGDFMEKAETGSIGRALALIGFGTQFAPELEEGERIVDAPVGGENRVVPEQPGEGNGNTEPMYYKVPFGKFAQKTLEEVGPDALRGYVEWMENNAKKTGKPIIGDRAEFVKRASEYVASYENGHVEEHA